MENQNNTGSQQTQAVIENIFLFKDGTIAIGCNLLSGTIKEGDKLYYSDCTGREGFPVTISGVMVPGKGAIPSISAGDENSKRAMLRITDCSVEKIHTGHLLQSEPEEVVYKEAPGWDALTAAFEAKYPDQKHPAHFGSYACFRPAQGPLDGISVYNGGDYFHFVTYGLSELYEKQNGNPYRSGYGLELTLKLKKEGLVNPMLEIRHVCSLLQMVAGITVNNGHQFLPGQYLPISQQKGFDALGKSSMNGFLVKEEELKMVDTPFGRVFLMQLVGITAAEIEAMKNQQMTPAQLLEKLGNDLTDYARK